MWSRLSWLAITFSLPALACTCSGGNVNSCQPPTADTIVVATVVSRESSQVQPPAAAGPGRTGDFPSNRVYRSSAVPPPRPVVRVTLKVTEWFHGSRSASLEIQTEAGTEACGYPFEVGYEYLVFANEWQGNRTVTTCSATQPAKMAIARIQQLRAVRDGTALPDLFGFVGTHPLRWDQTGWEQVQPVAGLTVLARSEDSEYRTQTADDGLYAFQGLPRGRYQMSVEVPPGRRAFWGGNAEHPGTSPGIGCPMNFEVFWDGRISGTVAGRDGLPASGIITAQSIGSEATATSLGSQVKDGRFEILKVPPGRYRLAFLPTAGGRPAGPTIYYPGTQRQSAAGLIEVGEGAQVEGLQLMAF